jgi:uncharacterized coiled-coil DUF342 family protein
MDISKKITKHAEDISDINSHNVLIQKNLSDFKTILSENVADTKSIKKVIENLNRDVRDNNNFIDELSSRVLSNEKNIYKLFDIFQDLRKDINKNNEILKSLIGISNSAGSKISL